MQTTVRHRNRIRKTILAFGSFATVLLALTSPLFQWRVTARAAAVTPQIQQLPITAFISLLRPTSRDTWFDPANGNLVVMDTFGKLNETFGLNLGTTVTGRVTVRDLGDGTQQVVIEGFTENALCYGFNGNLVPAFGYRLAELQNNVGPAALGRGIFRTTLSPQPIGPIMFPWPVESGIANLTCDGLLRDGSGYPEGTPGFAQTTQIALSMAGVPGGCPPEHDADCSPAEKVQFKATGN